MKDKGILLEVRGGKGIVMTPDGRFERVAVAPSDSVGDEVRFDRRSNPIERLAAFRYRAGRLRVGAIAAALIIGLVLALAGEAVRVRGTAVAYVGVDINPAVELGIDRNNRVVSVEGLDEDGRDVIEGLALKRMALEQAVEKLAGAAESKGYVGHRQEDNTVLITVTPARGNDVDPEVKRRVEAAREAVSRTLESKNVRGTVQVIHTAPEVREQAKKMNVTSGQLAIMLKAKDQGFEVFEAEAPAREPGKETSGAGAEGAAKPGRGMAEGAAAKEPGAKGTEEKGAEAKGTDAKGTGVTGGRAEGSGDRPAKGSAAKPDAKPAERHVKETARVLEEIIKGAKEEKDWPALVEKFGEEIGKQLKSMTTPTPAEKKGNGEKGEDDERDGDKRPHTSGGKPDEKPGPTPAVKPQVRPGDKARAREESAWDRWRKGLRKANLKRAGGSDAGRDSGKEGDDGERDD